MCITNHIIDLRKSMQGTVGIVIIVSYSCVFVITDSLYLPALEYVLMFNTRPRNKYFKGLLLGLCIASI